MGSSDTALQNEQLQLYSCCCTCVSNSKTTRRRLRRLSNCRSSQCCVCVCVCCSCYTSNRHTVAHYPHQSRHAHVQVTHSCTEIQRRTGTGTQLLQCALCVTLPPLSLQPVFQHLIQRTACVNAACTDAACACCCLQWAAHAFLSVMQHECTARHACTLHLCCPRWLTAH